mgnify:CR=1 FL=1
MTSIDIDTTSLTLDYTLFALKTRIAAEVSSKRGTNTTIDFNIVWENNIVEVYYKVGDQIELTSQNEQDEYLKKLIDKHYRNIPVKDRLLCKVLDPTVLPFPTQWSKDAIHVLNLNFDADKHSHDITGVIKDDKIFVRLDNMEYFRDAYNKINSNLYEQISELWKTGVIKLDTTETEHKHFITNWDLVKLKNDYYRPKWVEPRLEMFSASEMLLQAFKSYPDKTLLTFTSSNFKSLVSRHNISVWCKDILEEQVIYTEDKLSLKLLNIYEFYELLNYIFLREQFAHGNVCIFNTYVPETNVIGETTYLTSDGYIRSIAK